MSSVLDLFQQMYDDCRYAQDEIDRIESREADLVIKKRILQQARDAATDKSDMQYFIDELQKLSEESNELSAQKLDYQTVHKILIRRINIIQKASGKVGMY